MDLSNKVAVVTGSGQGLGLAYAKDLVRHGAAVVINDVNQATADAAVAEITAAGGRAVAVVAPVGSTETAQKLVAGAIDAFGRLDVMVTNAGILRDKVLWKMTDDDFDAVINVHLRGTFTCVREAVLKFREQGDGGRIICIGSPAGQRGNFGQTNYSGAKSGIVGMVRTWAMELQRAGITANAVCPVAATAMTETVPFLAPYIEGMKNGEPLPDIIRREVGLGTPEDAAGIISFLASDAAAEITGQAFAVGGDRLALWSHPDLTAVEYHDGGWSADDIAAQWNGTFGDAVQSVGEEFPEELMAK
ncbi:MULTISPECIES: 4-hydroxyphenyl-beta-hydroxyacyl-CoA dehydrogenase [Rhodococcus]|jgi:NAD(P)-dependent dehydrogenase (short-subunit alcohol dehydrogenase family)|uniref:4-hydroxyphenyl-beta-hydroxyacyl-CoA dehydrogenase n=2 Tax=Rhodococcus TaxID=1827 RepID=A0ABU4CJZ7_RHOJO|nr:MULTISPECIES: 4-hydroxyphenyl-beta-hydroxyacyl-CoA dehydrogenase [Rhodococcus]MDI9948477.1 4-hydroxyphenyl-beta-hydroxyacyl-CoA dehydrogenase [Rhodococcus sp. IEGM 1305]MDI9972508.1 4-hydroxyphenyl-beta-hydroxyacyl-CoA dehydrogenase [Rhodococcus sp. IEGM 1307]MDV6283891.1 4-hydroxyphenyl-beta-hydroxyacyl-CoA dehydrogenase [Rhodococcus jostii]